MSDSEWRANLLNFQMNISSVFKKFVCHFEFFKYDSIYEFNNPKNPQVAICSRILLPFKIEYFYRHCEPIFLLDICPTYLKDCCICLNFIVKYKIYALIWPVCKITKSLARLVYPVQTLKNCQKWHFGGFIFSFLKILTWRRFFTVRFRFRTSKITRNDLSISNNRKKIRRLM